MAEHNPVDESDIMWNEISARSYSEGWSSNGRSEAILRTKWYNIRRRIPSRANKTFRKAIQYCIENFLLMHDKHSMAFIDGYDSDYIKIETVPAFDVIMDDELELNF